MTERTLKEKVKRYLELKEEIEELEKELKKVKKSIENNVNSPVTLTFKDFKVSVKPVVKNGETIDKKLLMEKYTEVYRQVVKYYISQYVSIRKLKN